MIRLLSASRGASAIFAFDTLSVGVPAVLIGILRKIPVIIRVGGDFLWESYVERTKELIPLPDFYRMQHVFTMKERIMRMLMKWTLRHAQLAFNTTWLLEIWKQPYRIDPTRAYLVENIIGPRLAKSYQRDHSILLYSRQIALKNAAAFRSAFEKARADNSDLELAVGMIPYEKLMEKMQSCHAVAIPSISEVAPNNVIDAIRCGKPFLLTKYSGYAEKYQNMGIIIDPLDETDMARGIKQIADPVIYERLRAAIENYSEIRTYDDVARELLTILK